VENNSDKPKFRNLKKDEAKQVILAFVEVIKNISINGKPFVVNANSRMIGTNPQISMEEIQKTLGIRDKTKLDFIRQLYVRSGNKIINQLFPDENILNLPVLSFESNGAAIALTY